MSITYGEAQQARDAGKTVETRCKGIPDNWRLWRTRLACQCCYEFRIAEDQPENARRCPDCNGFGKTAEISGIVTCLVCKGRCAPIEVTQPDPYAHLKAAQAEGKVIQGRSGLTDTEWTDLTESGLPSWNDPVEFYRVKPDEPEKGPLQKLVEQCAQRHMAENLAGFAEPELKIEAGKNYQMRNGGLARVYAVLPSGNIHGARLDHGMWRIYEWAPGGLVMIGREGVYDLIAPWTDAPIPYDNWRHLPSWARWQRGDANGFWTFYKDEPDIVNGIVRPANFYHGPIPPEFAPTNYTGEDWRDSLQERPE